MVADNMIQTTKCVRVRVRVCMFVWFCGDEIDFVKLILTKIELKVKWFMFGNLNVKASE